MLSTFLQPPRVLILQKIFLLIKDRTTFRTIGTARLLDGLYVFTLSPSSQKVHALSTRSADDSSPVFF
ncbi:hypothetical protein LINPERHAP1_LOCUS24682 [Linum perenne]